MIKNIFKKFMNTTLILCGTVFATNATVVFGTNTEPSGRTNDPELSMALNAISSIYNRTKYVMINSYEYILGLGYKPFSSSNKLLKQIAEETSDIKIYGQKKAKEQCPSVIRNALYNIDKCQFIGDSVSFEQKGHIIYNRVIWNRKDHSC